MEGVVEVPVPGVAGAVVAGASQLTSTAALFTSADEGIRASGGGWAAPGPVGRRRSGRG